jgi:NAD+ diphosphatase
MWSCLAGFVEIAETTEDAVRREVLEEAGIQCTDVAYYRAQPWRAAADATACRQGRP